MFGRSKNGIGYYLFCCKQGWNGSRFTESRPRQGATLCPWVQWTSDRSMDNISNNLKEKTPLQNDTHPRHHTLMIRHIQSINEHTLINTEDSHLMENGLQETTPHIPSHAVHHRRRHSYHNPTPRRRCDIQEHIPPSLCLSARPPRHSKYDFKSRIIHLLATGHPSHSHKLLARMASPHTTNPRGIPLPMYLCLSSWIDTPTGP